MVVVEKISPTASRPLVFLRQNHVPRHSRICSVFVSISYCVSIRSKKNSRLMIELYRRGHAPNFFLCSRRTSSLHHAQNCAVLIS